MDPQTVERGPQRSGEKHVSTFFIRCTLVMLTVVWIFISIPVVVVVMIIMVVLWVVSRFKVCCCYAVQSFPEFLTTTELYWLYASSGAPSTIQCLIQLDNCVNITSIRDIVVNRMLNIRHHGFGTYTRLTKRLVQTWITTTWRHDDDFDIDNHVTEVKGKFISETDIDSHIAQMLSENLDFRRPLWGIEVLHSGWDNKTRLLVRMHPCFADGSALVELLCKSFSDNILPYKLKAQKSQTHSIVSIISGILFGPILLAYFRLQKQRNSSDVFQELVPSGHFTVASSRPVGFQKVLESQAVANCTISDFSLCAAAGAVRACIAQNSPQISQGDIRANLLYRFHDCSGACTLRCSSRVPWNAHYAKLPVRLPLTTEGIIPRLWDTLQCTRKLRQFCADSILSGVLHVIMNFLPAAPAARWLSRTLGSAKCLVTNLDGPASSLSVCGASVSSVKSWFPPGQCGLLSLSVLTYNKELRVGVTVDNCLNVKASALAEEFAVQIDTLVSFLAHRRFLRKSRNKHKELEDVDEFDDYPEFPDAEPEIRFDSDLCEPCWSQVRDSTILHDECSIRSQSGTSRECARRLSRARSDDVPSCSDNDKRLFVKTSVVGPDGATGDVSQKLVLPQLQNDVMIHVLPEEDLTCLQSVTGSITDVGEGMSSDKSLDKARGSSNGMTVITSVAVSVLDVPQSYEFSPCVERRGSSAAISEV